MKSGIYKITSPTNRVYIGKSYDVHKRIRGYKRKCKETQVRLFRSFAKHGAENHIFKIIEYCDISELNKRERYWQEHFDVLSNKGLNCLLNKTEDQPQILSKCSEFKRSEFLKKERSKQHCENLSKALKGIKRTDEMKVNMRAVWKKKIEDGYKPPIKKFKKRAPLSESTRLKIGKANTGRIVSNETRKKMSKNRSGIPSKQKILLLYNDIMFFESVSEASNILNLTMAYISRRLNGLIKKDSEHKFKRA